MEVQELRFAVQNVPDLKEKELNFLIEAYNKLYIKMYGLDNVDILSKLAKENISELILKKEEIKDYAVNYKRALNALETVKKDYDYSFLIIRNPKDLIGGGRIRKINDFTSAVVDIVIDGINNDDSRMVWLESLKFIEKYLKNNGCKKMYLEIPFKEGPLLLRAHELGFRENPDDIILDDEVKTYMLNKNLESDSNE